MKTNTENSESLFYCACVGEDLSAKNCEFIPLDLGAVELCEINGLKYTVPDVFYDQKLYNEIFEKTVLLLMREMLNPKLFPCISMPVNPLYVLMPQLVNLFGNAIHKIIELQHVIEKNHGKNIVLLTSNSYQGSEKSEFVYLVDYQILLSRYFGFRNDFELFKEYFPRMSNQEKTQPAKSSIKARFKLILRNTGVRFHNRMLARGSKHSEAAITWRIRDKSRIYNRIKSKYARPKILQGSHDYQFKMDSSNIEKMKDLLGSLTETLLSLFENNLKDKSAFRTLIEEIFVANCYKFVDPFLFHQKQNGPSDQKQKILFCHLSIEMNDRALYYEYYLKGYRVYSQEYSDGGSIGYAKSSSILYLMAPIASKMFFATDFYEGYVEYIQRLFPNFKFESHNLRLGLESL